MVFARRLRSVETLQEQDSAERTLNKLCVVIVGSKNFPKAGLREHAVTRARWRASLVVRRNGDFENSRLLHSF